MAGLRTKAEEGRITIFLEERIDTNNAPTFEKELFEVIGETPDREVILDAENLEYISSAGLRVLMKLRKQQKKSVPVLNASPDIYDIFQVTGFAELLDVRKKLREVSIEGCEELGSGANGTVYRLTPEEMIKVFRPGLTLEEIEQEREASRKTFLLGIPCAIAFDTVRCGDSYGTVYEMLNAATLTERIRQNPDSLDGYAKSAAELLKQLHEIRIPEGQMPAASRTLHATLDKLTADFTPEELQKLHDIYDTIPAMDRFVHNDFHTKNIMDSNGELMLIDLGDAGVGNPLIDLSHTYMVFNLIGQGITETKDEDMSFIGLTYGELKRFWKILSETYFGSEEKAAEMNEKLKPYGQLMYFTSAMKNPRLPAQYHPLYSDNVRKLVLSRYDELCNEMK